MRERERLYRAEGVVLRRRELGEADRLITLYTREHGRLRAVAKGIRRPRSRKSGHLELLARVMVLLARGRELDVITQAEAIQLYPRLREDLVLVAKGSYLAELVDGFAPEGEAHPGLYDLLAESLERLDQGLDAHAVVRHFELRLLDLMGYRPELFRCVGCGEAVRPQAQFFKLSQGGVLCQECGRGDREARPISLSALKVLRHFQRSGFEAVEGIHIRPQVQDELDHLMEGFLSYLLERGLRSPGFLRKVREKRTEHPPVF